MGGAKTAEIRRLYNALSTYSGSTAFGNPLLASCFQKSASRIVLFRNPRQNQEGETGTTHRGSGRLRCLTFRLLEPIPVLFHQKPGFRPDCMLTRIRRRRYLRICRLSLLPSSFEVLASRHEPGLSAAPSHHGGYLLQSPPAPQRLPPKLHLGGRAMRGYRTVPHSHALRS